MKRTGRLKKYVELFKRHIRQYLAPDICVHATIYPVEAEGAVFEFILEKGGKEREQIRPLSATVGKVLESIPQNLVGGNLENVRFGGTNLYLEGNRILVIKGEDEDSTWSGSVIEEDVQRVVGTAIGSDPDGKR